MAHFNNDEGDFTPDSLICGPYEARKIKIKTGSGKYLRGTVLGEITADGADKGTFVTSTKAATDGSQVADRVLMQDVDASGEDEAEGIAAISGRFDQDRLILGAGHTLGSIDHDLRMRSIFLENPMG